MPYLSIRTFLGTIQDTMIRTRIAPSPTGYPHIGTIYQALFNYGFAKKYGGKFLVRIEDTDRSRFVEDAEDKIFSSLDWFGLAEDESPRKSGPFSPYRQSERLDIYKMMAQRYEPIPYESVQEFYNDACSHGFDTDPRKNWQLIRITVHGTIEFRMGGATASHALVNKFARECYRVCEGIYAPSVSCFAW